MTMGGVGAIACLCPMRINLRVAGVKSQRKKVGGASAVSGSAAFRSEGRQAALATESCAAGEREMVERRGRKLSLPQRTHWLLARWNAPACQWSLVDHREISCRSCHLISLFSSSLSHSGSAAFRNPGRQAAWATESCAPGHGAGPFSPPFPYLILS